MARRVELERFTQVPQSEVSRAVVLLCQLERRGEGLDLVRPPFHSYNGGHAERKIFPHVAVLPRHSFNTNRADLRRRQAAHARHALQVTSPHATRIAVTSSSTRQAIRRFVSLVSRARQHYGVHGRSRRFRR